jgi:DNA-directed RNA polymerase subunit beta
MLTIKSDDVLGRAKAFEAIVKGVEIPEATIPESFKVLVRELNSLGLAVEPKGAVVAKLDEEIVVDEGTELAKAAGSELVATEELTSEKGPMEIEEVVA